MSVQNKQRDGGPHPDAATGRVGGQGDTTGITKPMTPARDLRDKAPVKEPGRSQWGRGVEQQYERKP